MELLMLLIFIVAVSRYAKKHDQTLLTREEYDELWRNSPYAHYRGIFTPEKEDDDQSLLR